MSGDYDPFATGPAPEDVSDAYPDGPPSPEPYNSGDVGNPTVVKRQSRKRKSISQEKDELLVEILNTAAGRALMWDILEGAHTFETKFATGPNGFPQIEATWFHAGEQSIGDRLFKTWLLKARVGTLLMMDEHYQPFKDNA